MEEVIAATKATVFFQLYVFQDREHTTTVTRVTEAGCKGLIVTVDTPEIGKRDDVRRGIRAKHLRLPNLPGQERNSLIAHRSHNPRCIGKTVSRSILNMERSDAFASNCQLPVIAKGICERTMPERQSIMGQSSHRLQSWWPTIRHGNRYGHCRK